MSKRPAEPRLATESVALEPVESLKAHPDNPRTGNLDALAESITMHGFYGAIIAQTSTRRILAGNHRWQAAQAAGLTEVPVAWVDVDDEQARRILLADNRTSDLATYDDAALARVLSELALSPLSLDGSGYDRASLDELLESVNGPPPAADDPGADIDQAAELRERWGTALGQVWEVGEHRIACGDSTDAAVVELVMAGEQAHCVWTDPPYGVSYVGKTNRALTIVGDGATAPDLTRRTLEAVRDSLIGGCPFYIAAPPGPLYVEFLTAVRDAGWRIHEELIWVKNSMVLGHSDYHYQHEPIIYGWLPGQGRSGRGKHAGSKWYGDAAQTSVFAVDRPSRSEDHPTMKPPALVAAMIANSTRRGEIVLDPFLGSGSTIVACEQTGRRGRGIELDPAYVAVALERLAGMGLTPRLREAVAA